MDPPRSGRRTCRNRLVAVSLAETLIPAGVGLVVGLVPFFYTVLKDRRERREREERERQRRLEHDRERRERDEKERQLEMEHERERLTAAATRYLDLLGQAMVLLEAIRVDADNADELLSGATSAVSSLQGHAQADLLVRFGASSPVVWADRACRRILKDALTMAIDARSQRQTGEAARQTQDALRQLTAGGVDPTHGPRDLFRWATTEAVSRWPEPLTQFEDTWRQDALDVANHVDLEIPAELLAGSHDRA